MDQDDETAFEGTLVMPFVTVTSKGGPHDDTSYTAGFECGQFDALCEQLPADGVFTYQPPIGYRVENAPQLDLIAMRHGLAATFTPSLGCERFFVFVSLARSAVEDPEPPSWDGP